MDDIIVGLVILFIVAITLLVEGAKNKKDDTSEYCEVCGNVEASYRLDPYQSDILNIEEYRWMCEYCYRESQNTNKGK